MFGKILKGIGGFYYVRGDDGNIVECKARICLFMFERLGKK